ncbi:TetR/AcrR family transcriptional regulator [Streptomyces sp. NBRC 109706]|uniref:TetR/AcrR family transcriptional regulator n=1 Tax=Streptomyces sp. NBRC 109706 TaxID=1550035 RepID=UPI00099B7655|nr:TetR/AcrR family transcriptional regulator [Streptomyces sp. NBRC 109706]
MDEALTEHGAGPTPEGTAASRRRSDARRNRARILRAAGETFAADGPDASLNEIARRAGVGPGTLYRHFPGRTELLAAVLTDRIETLCRHAETLRDEPDADRALADWLSAFLDHARNQQGLGSALLLAETGGLGFDCHQRLRDAAGAVLTRAQRDGAARPDLTVDELLALVVGIALVTARDAEGGVRQPPPARLLALVLDAIRAPVG